MSADVSHVDEQSRPCPYCGRMDELTRGSWIFSPLALRNNPHLVNELYWICWPCDAYTKAKFHQGERSSDIIADVNTRRARMEGHKQFDWLWKTRRMSRNAAYALLRKLTGLNERECHFKKMDADQCQRTIGILRENGLTWDQRNE